MCKKINPKIVYKTFLIFLIIIKTPLFSLSLCDLINLTLQNNIDIMNSQSEYESALLSEKTIEGSFSPGISISSSSSISNDYKWNTTPDYFSSIITYSQLVSSGTQISVSANYTFNSSFYNEERYLSQSPKISFTLTQSLLPFWAQGKVSDPTILSLKQQKEYYRYQNLYTKKTVLQNLIQNYAYFLIYENEIQIYENSISLVDEQIAVAKELKSSGYTNQTKFTELENTKWNYEETLMSVKANYYSCLQNIKSICGINIDNSIEFGKTDENLTNLLLVSFEHISDPMELIYQLKLQMLDTKNILQKQNSAPTLSLSVQPSWSLESVITNDWQDAWKNGANPSWTVTVNMDFSPFLRSTISKDKKHYDINYQQTENSYKNYLIQKKFVNEQYEILYKNYSDQLEIIEKLLVEGKDELKDYEKLYIAGAISKLDFDSVKIKVENCELSKNCVEMYRWLYGVLLEIN